MSDITQHRNAHNSDANMHEVKGFPSASKGYSYAKNIQGVSEWQRNFRQPNAKNLINGYEVPTTEVDGDVYAVTAPELDVNAITWQSGTTVRYTFTSGYTSTLYATGSYLQVSGEVTKTVHNGVFVITTVNASYLEVTNALVTDATDDVASASAALGYVTHEDFDPENNGNGQSIPRNGLVKYFGTPDLWYGDDFQEGDEYYNETLNSKESFNGTAVINNVGYKVYSAFINQSSTSAPTATVLENTLGGVPSWAYTSVGKYTATLTGVFTANKTVVIPPTNWGGVDDSLTDRKVFTAGTDDANTFYVNSGTVDASGVSSSANGQLFTGYSFIEIRVYP